VNNVPSKYYSARGTSSKQLLYHVKSDRGIQFRIWANKIIKEYLLRGYAVNQRFERIESNLFHLKKKLQEI
jgi:hypothetical protein